MKSQIFIQLHIAFFAQILHNLNLKQQIFILFPEHLRGDQRAQQKVFTPSDWINLSSNLEKKQERKALRQSLLGPSRQPPSQGEHRLQNLSDTWSKCKQYLFGSQQYHPLPEGSSCIPNADQSKASFLAHLINISRRNYQISEFWISSFHY